MTEFLDKNFAKEFKQLMMELRNETSLNIRDLPTPFSKPALLDKVYVKGIEDEIYSKLNGKFVVRSKKSSITRNIYRNNGEIKTTTNYVAKEGNVLIITTENLRLPFRYKASDPKLEYVDFRESDGQRTFIYSIPKDYLYLTKQTALVLAQNTKRSHYGGLRLTLTNGYDIYLYIVSLNNVREREGNVPLVTKTGDDYREELDKLQNFWLQKAIIFPKNTLELDMPIKDTTNLGYKIIEPVDEYTGIDEYSIKERLEMRSKQAY
ncbi:hypothetical protein COF68_05655 [Bacillus toyonensis]|uniref:hypothetical protein n=1 Tax=Bacillus toyonensis TaxID=155322 RepID=UPI000BFC2DBE|nr:hypothetical protein [Bacillus toyonensis]PHE64327.1 hypothetical protein COF68_05655 [Bacillus toyonensis]